MELASVIQGECPDCGAATINYLCAPCIADRLVKDTEQMGKYEERLKELEITNARLRADEEPLRKSLAEAEEALRVVTRERDDLSRRLSYNRGPIAANFVRGVLLRFAFDATRNVSQYTNYSPTNPDSKRGLDTAEREITDFIVASLDAARESERILTQRTAEETAKLHAAEEKLEKETKEWKQAVADIEAGLHTHYAEVIAALRKDHANHSADWNRLLNQAEEERDRLEQIVNQAAISCVKETSRG